MLSLDVNQAEPLHFLAHCDALLFAGARVVDPEMVVLINISSVLVIAAVDKLRLGLLKRVKLVQVETRCVLLRDRRAYIILDLLVEQFSVLTVFAWALGRPANL